MTAFTFKLCFVRSFNQYNTIQYKTVPFFLFFSWITKKICQSLIMTDLLKLKGKLTKKKLNAKCPKIMKHYKDNWIRMNEWTWKGILKFKISSYFDFLSLHFVIQIHRSIFFPKSLTATTVKAVIIHCLVTRDQFSDELCSVSESGPSGSDNQRTPLS